METESQHKMAPSTKLALCIFIAVGGFYIWTEHQAHLFEALPYLFFLLCPLMHIFMHHGHEKHHGDNSGAEDGEKKDNKGNSGCH